MVTGKDKRLVIFGLEDFSDIAYEYFTYDSSYEVVAFTAHREYISASTKNGLPVVPFEELADRFPPETNEFFAALVYSKLNRFRRDVAEEASQKGYALASYVSSRAFVWRNVSVGRHCFIFEDNTIQPFVQIGNNVVMWSGNHIGHHSTIGDHCFFTSHVVVSGWCDIGPYSFVGVNSTLANNTKIGEGCWVSHGAVIAGDVPRGSLVRAQPSSIDPLNEAVLFRSLGRASKKRERF